MSNPIYDSVMAARKAQLALGALEERARVVAILQRYEKRAKVVAQILREVQEGEKK